MRQPVPRLSFLRPVSIRPLGLGRPALDDGPIDVFGLAAREQCAEAAQRLRMPAKDEATGGVAVETMRERRRMRQTEAQLIKRALEVGTPARPGMHGDPRRFVEHEDQPVAIEDALGEPHKSPYSAASRLAGARKRSRNASHSSAPKRRNISGTVISWTGIGWRRLAFSSASIRSQIPTALWS